MWKAKTTNECRRFIPANPNASRRPIDDGEEGVPHSEEDRHVEMVDPDRPKNVTKSCTC